MPTNVNDEELAKAIRDRLQSHGYLSHLVKPLGVGLLKLIDCAKRHGIRYRNAHPSNSQIAAAIDAVTVEGLTLRAAAVKVGMSRSAVHRYVSSSRNSYVSEGLDFLPIGVDVYRCPRHGLMRISPCIACEAAEVQPKARYSS